MAKKTFTPTNLTLNGKLCRVLFSHGLVVSIDGKDAYKQTKAKVPTSLTIQSDPNGRTYVNVARVRKSKYAGKSLEKVYIDDAVNTCFNGSKPDYRYITWHKDNNLTNNNASNLEWKLYYQHTQTPSIPMIIGGNKVTVNKNGTVIFGGSVCQVVDNLYDPDVTAENVIAPYIGLPRKGSIYQARHSMDRIMDEAGYVNGDKYAFENPVVYHKDHDRMNFDSSNLEWRDRADKDYIEYMADATDEEIKRIKELNKGRDFPNHWIENKWRDELNKLNAASGTGTATAQTTVPTTTTTPNPQNPEQDEPSGV